VSREKKRKLENWGNDVLEGRRTWQQEKRKGSPVGEGVVKNNDGN